MQAIIPLKRRPITTMPTFGIYDGGPNAEHFTKVGERDAVDHAAALEALETAKDGHIYGVCGASHFGETSRLLFIRASVRLVQRAEITAQRLATFRGESDPEARVVRHAEPLTPPDYLGTASPLFPGIYR